MKVLTLNVAHGRKDGLHQSLQGKRRIQANLDDIAGMLRREHPDVVAIQEADGPSLWSGRFDHVAYLAEQARYPHYFRGEHVRRLRLVYGTALLSRGPLGNVYSHKFQPSPPTPSKGFVTSTVQWPDDPNYELEVTSVHMDFSRRSVRQRQVQELIRRLAACRRPLVVMGDFNCDLVGRDPSLPALIETLELHAHDPLAQSEHTYPGTKKRIDWILISRDLEFLRYERVDERLSDHLGVLAVLRRRHVTG